MNARLRFLVVLLGAMVVAATFTFNLWFPLVVGEQNIVLFPELPEDMQEAFEALPPERLDDYLALRASDPALAARLAFAALQPPRIVPDEEQANPQRSGQVATLQGDFVGLTPNRTAEGTVTLYELPDGSRYLWLETFSTVPGLGLRLFLSSVTPELLLELAEAEDGPEEYRLSPEDLLLDPLRFEVGSQAYEVPSEADLSRYNSVIIYSTEFDLLWAYAVLGTPSAE